MENNIFDFLKNDNINYTLLIKNSDIKEDLVNEEISNNHITTIYVNATNIISELKDTISTKNYDLIINDTEIFPNNFLDILHDTYKEIPLLIIKSGTNIDNITKYNLSVSPISEDYKIVYIFSNLDEKLSNEKYDNPSLNHELNQIYLSEYENNQSLKNKLYSTFYPLSLLVNSNKLGGIKNLPLNIKGYKKLRNSDFLNIGYYLRTNNIKEYNNIYLHYLYTGSKKGYQPNEEFNNQKYLELNPDLKRTTLNPSIHYLLYGKNEGRQINIKIKGVIQTSVKNNILKGWIAEIDNYKPVNAKLKIDNEYFPIEANIYREDLEKKNINHGEHGFEFEIPKKFKDKKDHNIKLLTEDNIKIHEINYNILINDKESANVIKGAFQTSIKDTLIKGWIAEIGNNNPVDAVIKIDDETFPINANIYREDLKRKNINEGKHGFEFIIPEKFIDGVKHDLKLISNNKIISTTSHTFNNYDYENNIERFFSNSMTSPEMVLPANEPRKKILALMNNIAKYLINEVKDNPLVSVIMPVYNRENLIENAIQSVLNQSYKNIELIIVNDNSSDKTLEQIKKIDDERIKVINNPINYGVSKSRNIALKESEGKYIMYLDSDNDWEKDYVKAMVGAFSVNPDADCLYSGQYVYEKDKNNLKYMRYGTINKGLLSNRNYIDLNCFCHTRGIYENEGGFDETLKRFVDWDLILKYATFGKIYSIPIIMSNYYNDIAENSISNNVKLLDQSEEVIKKHKNRINSIKYDFNITCGVSVIIPSYESLDDLKECLNSLFNLNAPWLEIIVVDNNSNEDVIRYLVQLKDENKIKLILNKENVGFTFAVTQGIEISDIRNDIVLLNNDAIVTENAIQLLQKAAYELDDCGMTVPQQILPGNTKTITKHVPFAQKDNECDVNLSNHHKNIINTPLFHNGEYTEVSFAPFFCVYIKRDTYNKSVGLDAELGRHFRSDMIYCNYIRTVLNQKIYHVSDARVYHKLQQATGTLKQKSEEKYNLLYVQNRWSEEEQEKYGFKRAKWDFD